MINCNSCKLALALCGAFNKEVKGKSIIAGGFLRDIDLGRQPKDIDLVVEYSTKEDVEFVLTASQMAGYETQYKTSGYAFGEVVEIVCLECAGELPVDVIFIDIPVLERLNVFPCNISKIYMNETKAITRLPEYLSGVLNKQITYNKDTTRASYMEKMLGYFPDWEHLGGVV